MGMAERMVKREERDKKKKISLTFLLVGAGIIIVATVVLLIVFLNTKKFDSGIYYYDTGVRYEQQDAVIKNDNDNGVYLENSDRQGEDKLILSSAPLYYADQPKIFIPCDTTITFPSKRKVARISKFSEFEDRQGAIFAKLGRDEYEIDEGFLYDGKNTFVFFDDMTVSWDGKAIELPALSYAIVVYNQRIELYPYGADSVVEQTGSSVVTASADTGYTIDLSVCILTNAEGIESLLISEPSMMEPFTGE